MWPEKTDGKARRVFKINKDKWLWDEGPGSFLLTNLLINKCLGTVLGTVCWVCDDFIQSFSPFWLLRSCLLSHPLPSFFLWPLLNMQLCQTGTPKGMTCHFIPKHNFKSQSGLYLHISWISASSYWEILAKNFNLLDYSNYSI